MTFCHALSDASNESLMTVKTVVRLAYSTSVFKNVLSRWPCIMNLITRKEFYIFFSRLDSQRGDFYDPIEYLLFRPSIWNPLITLISPIRKIDFNQFYFFSFFKSNSFLERNVLFKNCLIRRLINFFLNNL